MYVRECVYVMDRSRRSIHTGETRTRGKEKEDTCDDGTWKDKIRAWRKEWRSGSKNGNMGEEEIGMKGCKNEWIGLWAWMKYYKSIVVAINLSSFFFLFTRQRKRKFYITRFTSACLHMVCAYVCVCTRGARVYVHVVYAWCVRACVCVCVRACVGRLCGLRVHVYAHTYACVMRGARQAPLDLLLLVYNVYSQWNYYYYY